MKQLHAMSKISTAILIAASGIALAGCSHKGLELQIQPGPSGTFIALGSEVEGSITSGSTTFDFNRSAGRGLSIGVAVSGPYPQSKDEAKLFKPASITKLVTTALALKKLGSGFKYSTNIYYKAGTSSSAAKDLTIIANGDPQVVTRLSGDGVAQHALLSEIAARLKEQGISRLEGSLILLSADSRRDAAIPAAGMDESDHTKCFGAVSQSFNYMWNCAALNTRNGNASWVDQNLAFPIVGGSGDGERSPARPLFSDIGRVVSFAINGHSNEPLQLPISDVKPWYGRALLSVISASGIDTSSVKIETPSASESAQVRANLTSDNSFAIESDSLSELVKFTNKPSDNYFADTLFKTVAEKNGPGSDLRAEGQAAFQTAIAGWMRTAGHADYANEVHLIDGAGLSHDNRVSARAYMTLLREFTKEPTFASLWNSLPIAGVDGTLKSKMNNTSAVGRVRAKTGTLNGSYQLAGYVPKYAADGTTVEAYIPFVILSAVDAGKRFNVFKLQSELAVSLLKLVNPEMRF